jgi:hypothetical protein
MGNFLDFHSSDLWCSVFLKGGEMNNMTKFISIVLSISALMMLVSCQKQSAEWKGIIEEVDGIIVVKNPKKPMYGEGVFSMEEDLTLGEKEGREEYMFSRIIIDVDDNENIYILDVKASNIRVFDKNGKHLKTFGKIGQGPGEFQKPIDFIQITPQRELAVYDLPSRHFIFFSLEGKYLRQLSGARIGGVLAKVKIDTCRNFVVRRLGGPPSIELHKYNANLEPLLTIFKEEEKPSPRGELNVLKPYLYFEITKDNNIVWGFSDKYELQVLNPEGELERRITKDYKPVKINEKEKEIIRERYARLATLGMSYKLNFPKYFPPFESLTIDDKGRIFIGTYEKTEDGWEYHDVFDAEGRYIVRVPLQATPYIWKKNRMYSIYRDEEGYRFVKRYKVTWKY